jgi:hypothetical protein
MTAGDVADLRPGQVVLVSADVPPSSDGTSPAGLVARALFVLPDSVFVRGWGLPIPRAFVRVCDRLERCTLLPEGPALAGGASPPEIV